MRSASAAPAPSVPAPQQADKTNIIEQPNPSEQQNLTQQEVITIGGPGVEILKI